MINSISCTILDQDGKKIPDSNFSWNETRSEGELTFSLKLFQACTLQAIWVDVYFSSPISKWRHIDYTWINPNSKTLVANVHSPKILKLESNDHVVPKRNLGCWQYQSSHHLRWFFWHPMLSPTMVYDSKDMRHFLKSKEFSDETKIQNGLYFSQGKVQEWARTPNGFLPTICFTDHSDFDTIQNLKVQRDFFKKNNIKTTKGFFLYDFSHKGQTASYQSKGGKAELDAWKKDGHELAYHALSQSYRGEISEAEFMNFEAPLPLAPIDTYIDHGFHPYNFTKQKLGDWEKWYAHVYEKGIRRIWTYVDAGEANFFNLNQLNPRYYTLRHMTQSSRFAQQYGIKRNWKTSVRNYLMYGVSEEILQKGKLLGGDFRNLLRSKSIQSLGRFILNSGRFLMFGLKPENIKHQFSKSKRIFEFNRFGAVFFEAPNQKDTKIDAFQSLAVRDYDIAFSKDSLERFIREKGLVIAHTYFAYSGANHEGRLFKNGQGEFRPEAKEAFERVGRLIKTGHIWNPTLRELHSFHQTFHQIEYTKISSGLKVKNFEGIVRDVK
ncbi:MAG: hypothetical protein HWD85_10065 [Flavobacteriaceae bacterium]|nr:hypothetical protein [Flavobacteriaceae bacterium]